MVNEYKKRVRHHLGIEIILEYDPGDWVGIPKGWVYSLYDKEKEKDYGYNGGCRLPFNEALREAKSRIDTIRKSGSMLEDYAKLWKKGRLKDEEFDSDLK